MMSDSASKPFVVRDVTQITVSMSHLLTFVFHHLKVTQAIHQGQ